MNELVLPLSHHLPFYKQKHIFFDTALSRLSTFLYERDRYLRLIDIGANVGAMVSFVSREVAGEFLCVEPDPKYFAILQKNTKTIKNVVCENALCDEQEHRRAVSMERFGGSGRVREKSNNTDIRITTVDNLVSKYPNFSDANIIKVDTEGYDYRVLRGAKRLLEAHKPAIFFELHPSFLSDIDEDPMFIFGFLSSIGYKHALIYDNFGVVAGRTPLIDIDRISNLLMLIKNQQIIDPVTKDVPSYFDILTIFDAHASNQFCQLEEQFYGDSGFYLERGSQVCNRLEYDAYTADQ